MGCTITMPMITRFQSVRARRNRGAPVTPASLLKRFLPMRNGAALHSLWLVVLTRREPHCGNFTLLNRFNASNSARSSQMAQAQSFKWRNKTQPFIGVDLVQVRTNRLAVPRQVPQYGIV